ncbi:MAG TPA: M20/M25/M40 family metallo-hydrolase [Candidatus Acidoferrum sp.]|nr:M20/M25/M40 family metallo-hydrolase [Candidatus Acidoferrum sp.]
MATPVTDVTRQLTAARLPVHARCSSHPEMRKILRQLKSGNSVILPVFCLLASAAVAGGQTPDARDYRPLAREIFQELVEIKSTESGVGSTPAAEAMARRLLAAGFPATDVLVIGPNERKKNLVARLHGKGNGKPVLLLAHLDVVEAKREDWSPDIDPFRLVERDGYFYGRGTQDIKDCVAFLVTNFIRWKQEGWVPSRDLILALTADEEGAAVDNGIRWLLQNHRELIDAEYSLNADAGDFQSKNGRPYIVPLAAAEKKATFVQLQTTNRGGHGGLPRKDNAIFELTAALQRLANFQFPVMVNDITRSQFAAMSKLESGQVAADMHAVGHNRPGDAAIRRLSENPYYNALLRTTCVATMLEGGHAPNALPQRAKAVLNCRILPGHSSAKVLQTLENVVNDKQVEVRWQFVEDTDWPASQLRPDVLAALAKVAQQLWPGVVVMPDMETGASDCRFLRGAGIPSFGASGVFIDVDDVREHGRDERIRVRDFFGGLEFYDQFAKTLVK